LTSSPNMAGETPEKGDKVSWNWGGGAPGGKVAETKEHGEIAIQSKKGNTIKKNASPDNPAVHIERSGNDVVKRANELNIEEKASGSNGKKRDHEADADGPITENADGKDVKKQKTEKKSTKTQGKKNTAKAAEEKKVEEEKAVEEEKEEEEKEEEKEEKAEKKDTKAAAAKKDEPKKKAGRPKGTGSAAGEKKKKEAKPRATEGIGSRTRSRN